MTGVSTANSYAALLTGFTSAQTRLNVAQQQISSGELAGDLKGYGAAADALTATKTVKSRLDAYVATGSALSDRLDAQANALDGVSSAGGAARSAVFGALAEGDGAVLMQQLQSQYEQASDALNVNYQGQYLFSGGQTDTPPVKAGVLTDLPAGSPFQNGTLKATSRIDDNVTVQTGQLADQVGKPLFDVLGSIASYVATTYPATGAFPTQLSAADTAFLQSTLSRFDTATANVSGYVAQTGTNQSQIASAQARVADRQSAAAGVLSDVADADPAKAATNLQLAQVAVQASAQLFTTLKGASLLDLLSPTA